MKEKAANLPRWRVSPPIIVTFHARASDLPVQGLKAFDEAAWRRGFVVYPGKLTQIETFRVDCIGAIGVDEIEQAVHAVDFAMREMGLVPR